jgi:hypothetical protein
VVDREISQEEVGEIAKNPIRAIEEMEKIQQRLNRLLRTKADVGSVL